MFRNRYAMHAVGHACMLAASDYSEPNLAEWLTARSAEPSVKSMLCGDLYLIYSGVLRLFLYHVEVRADGVLNVSNGLVKCVSLAVVAWKRRTMCIEYIFCFVYDYSVFHNSKIGKPLVLPVRL